MQRFRRQISGRVLHYTFSMPEEFARMLRMHLSAELAQWGRTWGNRPDAPRPERATEPAPSAAPTVPSVTEEELGLLDLVEVGSEHMNNVTDSTTRMTQETEGLTAKLTQRAAELEAVKGDDQKKRVVNRAAADLADFVSRMEVEVPLMAGSVEKGLDAAARAVELLPDFGEQGRVQARAFLETIRALEASIEGTRPGLATMRGGIAGFPRLTAHLNRAKRTAVDLMERLDKELEKASRMCGEVERVILRILDDQPTVT